MAVIFQDLARANRILDALTDLAEPTVNGLRIAVAYTTFRGSQDLVRRAAPRVNKWDSIPKTLITTLDYGLTEPGALSYLQSSQGFTIRVANVGANQTAILRPTESFHPKLYVFDSPSHVGSLIGSPNLTQRALRTNTEIAELSKPAADLTALEDAWSSLVAASTELTDALLKDYSTKRVPARRPFDPESPVAAPASVPAAHPASVDDAVQAGLFDPKQVSYFWVEAGSMSSGGSGNQLELPRGAHLIFGYPPMAYSGTGRAVVIGNVPLILPGRSPFADRRLSWHSHNQMERLNLPTKANGAPDYPHTVVLFRRQPTGFELEVELEAGPIAPMWRRASRAQNLMFRLGAAGTRHWGVF